MSMSTSVIAFQPPDEKWKKMKAVYDAAIEANIDVPEEVWDFFNGDPPEDSGVSINLSYDHKDICQEWSDDMQNGYELDLEKLKDKFPHITKIRFYNSF